MASDAGSAFNAAVASLTLWEVTYEQVEVLAVLLNQEYDTDGALVDVVDVSFRLRGRPGQFAVHVPFLENWVAIAFVQIGLKHAYVNGIYEGLASKDDLPAGPIGTPLVPIGGAVPV